MLCCVVDVWQVLPRCMYLGADMTSFKAPTQKGTCLVFANFWSTKFMFKHFYEKKSVFIMASRGRPLMQPWWNAELLNPKATVNSQDANQVMYILQGNCVNTTNFSHVVWSPHIEPSPFITNISGQCLPYDDTCCPSGGTLVSHSASQAQMVWQSHCAELTTLMRVHFEVNYPIDKTVMSRPRKLM